MTIDRYLLPEVPHEQLSSYVAAGGGLGLAAARGLEPRRIMELVRDSGLRGRGGAGFPTGAKWASIAEGGPEVGTRYLVANGAEGEPGTFKDRTLLRLNPYQVLEGLVIAARAVGAFEAFVAIKRSFGIEYDRLTAAIAEVEVAGWLEDVSVKVVRGPEEYLFGEEKALLEVVEGEDPLPRQFPPYLYGLFTTSPQIGWSAGTDSGERRPGVAHSNPTLVNNVETLAHVPAILRNGVSWFRSTGTPETPGHVICTVSGDTQRAAVDEVRPGTPVRDVISELGGGVAPGRSVKAVLSGVANPVLTRNRLAAPLSYEGLRAVGSGMGSAGFLVFDDTTDMVSVAYGVSRFLYVESCGQCPACKFGTGEITAYLARILEARATSHDLEIITARMQTVTDANRCSLPVQEREVVASILRAFPEDVADHLAGRQSDEYVVTKIVDIAGGEATLDHRQANKRPDWTYAEAPIRIPHR